MAFDYESIRDGTVIPLLEEFGKSGNILSPGVHTGPAYDPQPGADGVQPVTCLQVKLEQGDIDGKVVLATDSVYLVSPKNVTSDPTPKDRLQADGGKFQILKVRTVRPGSTTLIWRVIVRK